MRTKFTRGTHPEVTPKSTADTAIHGGRIVSAHHADHPPLNLSLQLPPGSAPCAAAVRACVANGDDGPDEDVTIFAKRI